MTKRELIKKHPELFIEIIKEGIELALFGYTDVTNCNDVKKYEQEIKDKLSRWKKSEKDYLQLT